MAEAKRGKAAVAGPWGGSGGTEFDDGVYGGVVGVVVVHAAAVDSVQIQYDRRGSTVWSDKHGGVGGTKRDVVTLDYPYEFLTSISGCYGSISNGCPIVVRSLAFQTNLSTYGPYGFHQGTHFTFSMKGMRIVGFYGRSGWYLDSIGVYLKPLQEFSLLPVATFIPSHEGRIGPLNHYVIGNDFLQSRDDEDDDDNNLALQNNFSRHYPSDKRDINYAQPANSTIIFGVVKELEACGAGPWGGDGGKPWDDGVFSGIKQILVTRRHSIVTSIQIEYDMNGHSVWSTKHGAGGGDGIHRVQFQYPNEVLNCISGYYRPISWNERSNVVTSLTFYTTRGEYGPIGEEIGTYFISATTQGKVIGFHGRSGMLLDAIGVHMQHWFGERKIKKPLISNFMAF